ncbi:MAG: S-adenosylmethionine decarboxylase [Bacteriovoracaceae bacterium]|jgi:S-adenosylmethionine decarboxylase
MVVFFEGSEKKVEVVVNSEVNLLSFEKSFWEELVLNSTAQILSSIENSKTKAFLLSESSLFVWEDRFVLITCGQTTLVKAIEFFLSKIPSNNIASLIFQRKNEYFSHLQKSSFLDDVKALSEQIEGTAYRFGKMHEHHNFMYCSNKEYTPSVEDKTIELLMYEISPEASTFLNKSYDDPKIIRDFLQLEKLFPDYIIDDYAFSPQGYSVNAIKDDLYFTIHITPEEFNSYISFETNEINSSEKLHGLMEILKPETFDVVSFNYKEGLSIPDHFHKRTKVTSTINLGYDVIFSHFYSKETVNDSPYILNFKENK